MKRIKQCFCSILVILILTATLPTAAANGTGGVILAFDNKVLAKVGNDFSYSVTAYDFEKDREISGSFLLEIEFPKIFTVKGISFNGQRLAAGDGYYVNKNNVVKILSDFAFNGNSVTDKYLQWSIILSVAEETSEKNHMISAGRSTVLYDDDSNLIPLICKKGSICVIDRDSFKNGDVNKDLKTDSLDLSLLRKKLIGCDTADFDLLAADVNGDNTLDIRDLVALKRELVSAEYGIVYLSQTGSDIGTGGEDNPLKSFNKAMAMVSDGGTVYIIGTYSLCSDDIWNYNGKDIVISGGELDAAALDVLNIGKPFLLFRASEPSWAEKIKDNWVTDGPFMYRTKSDRLLMIWSSGTNKAYVEAVSYSDNGEITGDWKHCSKLLFDKNGGHGMIFKSFDGQKYFVYHYPNIPSEERPVLRKIRENGDTLEIVD